MAKAIVSRSLDIHGFLTVTREQVIAFLEEEKARVVASAT